MKRPSPYSAPGPFRADQLRSGDPYELHNGHAIRLSPTGGQGSGSNLIGGAVILSDPAVQNAGVDAGFSPNPGTLRAPDVAVLPANPGPGWIQGVPPLAIEYAGPGQDETGLTEKIEDLLGNGTRFVWVVRLGPVPYVEVWQPDVPMRLAHAGEDLTAPGVLANPIPVQALWNLRAGESVMLRNLLQRFGYRDLDEVRAEGVEAGRAAGVEAGRAAALEEAGEALRATVRAAYVATGAPLTEAESARLDAERDPARLTAWITAAVMRERPPG